MPYPNTLDEAIELAQWYFGAQLPNARVFNDTTMNQRIANNIYIETVRDSLCGDRKIQTIATVAGTREYANPNDYAATDSVQYVVNNTEKYPMGFIYSNQIEENQDYPRNYYLKKGCIGIDPIPSNSFAIERSYFSKPVTDLAGTDVLAQIPEDFRYVVSEGITAQFFLMDKLDTTGGFNRWQQKYQADILRLKDYIQSGQNQQEFGAVG